MIPLLYESGLDSLCSEIWVVNCTEKQQRQRLIQRNGLSAPQQADQRIQAQWPLARKCQLADQVIDNSNDRMPGKPRFSVFFEHRHKSFGIEDTGWRRPLETSMHQDREQPRRITTLRPPQTLKPMIFFKPPSG